ncbi:MAG: aspartyl/asparaginyl beta-hydroxylase domain-containing protein [Planctomycetota bacterium]
MIALGLTTLQASLLVLVGLYLACVLAVHYRGKVRLRFRRQLTEHSGMFAWFNCLLYGFSAVPNKAFLDLAAFPQAAPLRDNWKTIRDEAVALLTTDQIRYDEKHKDLTFMGFQRRGWKRFHLKWYSDFLPSARKACPRTVELLQSIPQLNSAAFTLLPPGKKLGRHRDPFANSVRYHLGLVTPNSEDCRIWVDGEEYSWRDGEDVVFDQTFVHWARNDTDTPRIILFCDFTRPVHTAPMRAFLSFMNRRIFGITASHNEPGEAVGLLNRATPVVFGAKTFFIGLKRKHRAAYTIIKQTSLALLLIYAVYRLA